MHSTQKNQNLVLVIVKNLINIFFVLGVASLVGFLLHGISEKDLGRSFHMLIELNNLYWLFFPAGLYLALFFSLSWLRTDKFLMRDHASFAKYIVKFYSLQRKQIVYIFPIVFSLYLLNIILE